VQLEVTWDRSKIEPFLNQRLEKAVGRAVSKAGGDAIRTLRVESSRVVRQRRRIKVARVNRSLELIYPRSKEIDSLVWRMDVSRKPIPIAEYPHRQTRSGVTVAIKTAGRVLIKSAFVATMRSGHEGVFLRLGKSRLPIKELFTTRVSDVFGDTGMVPSVLAQALGKFDTTFDRVLPLEIAKLK
jgi:hypothetical protein